MGKAIRNFKDSFAGTESEKPELPKKETDKIV
jgi:hypothetical protein